MQDFCKKYKNNRSGAAKEDDYGTKKSFGGSERRNLFACGEGIFGSQAGRGLAACVFYRPCMVDTMEKRRRLGVQKTQDGCSLFPCLQGGDDEAAESGTEMVVRFGVLRRRGMVAEMLAVVGITPFPLGAEGGVFEDG